MNSRTAKKTKPPTMAMCRPEIDSTCARPLSRMAWVSSGVTKASWPVVMATATPPAEPPMDAWMRRLRLQRRR